MANWSPSQTNLQKLQCNSCSHSTTFLLLIFNLLCIFYSKVHAKFLVGLHINISMTWSPAGHPHCPRKCLKVFYSNKINNVSCVISTHYLKSLVPVNVEYIAQGESSTKFLYSQLLVL